MYSIIYVFKVFNAVNVTLTSQDARSNSITLTFSTTCQSFPTYDVDNITDLYLKAVEMDCTENCTTMNTSFTVQCYQNLTSVTVKNLNKATTYSLSVFWISPSNSSDFCRVLNNDVIERTGCSDK